VNENKELSIQKLLSKTPKMVVEITFESRALGQVETRMDVNGRRVKCDVHTVFYYLIKYKSRYLTISGGEFLSGD
jgi:predicted ester cyclase